jgi:hypothetical protein
MAVVKGRSGLIAAPLLDLSTIGHVRIKDDIRRYFPFIIQQFGRSPGKIIHPLEAIGGDWFGHLPPRSYRISATISSGTPLGSYQIIDEPDVSVPGAIKTLIILIFPIF